MQVTHKQELEQMIENLAEGVIEHLKSGPEEDYEAFEAYAKKVRIHIYDHLHEGKLRCARGYAILLEEVIKEEK
jgi:predicted adenine nucleotide alpha hydrolase (AANH) superfamily ATPase